MARLETLRLASNTALVVLAICAPPSFASPADSIHVEWRRGDHVERRVLPKGAHELRAIGKGSPTQAAVAFDDRTPRPYIVRFGAPPRASARPGRADLEATRAPHRRFVADLAGLEAAVRAEHGEGAAAVALRHRLEVSFNGVAITASSALVERMKRLDYVAAVHPDDSVHARLDQSLAQIKADSVSARLGATGSGIVVSIIDTGIDYRHPALGGCFGPGCRVIGGWDFANRDADPLDDHGHGTHVAGIAAGSGAGLTGVAPAARLLAYKVLAASGGGLQSDVIAAIDRSLDPDDDPLTDDAADVINLSLGGPGDADSPVSQAVDRAVAAGVVCVVAAGNSGDYFRIEAPGSARHGITVGAATSSDQIAGFSSRGPTAPDDAIKPDVVAPGVAIVSAWPGGASMALSGTSMATPHVAGVAALLLDLHPEWTPETIKAALMNTSAGLGVDPFQQGAGRIDALAAATIGIRIEPASLSFGVSPAAAPHWTAVETLVVRNDSAHETTVTLSASSNLPAGSYFAVGPGSVTLAPGEARTLVAALTLDHAPSVTSAPHAYHGVLRTYVDGRTLHVPFAVVRCPQLVLRTDDAGLLVVHDRARFQTSLFASGPGVRRLFVPAGTYDVIASLGANSRIVREGIVVADSASAELRVADASHAVERVCVDERGVPITLPIGVEYLRHRQSGFGVLTIGSMAATTRLSTTSSEYDWEWHRLSYGLEPTTYDFQGATSGVSASAVWRNAASDLRRLTVTYHPSPSLRQLLPIRWISDGPIGTETGNGFAVSSIGTSGYLPPLEAPFTQDVWFIPPSDPGLHFRSRLFGGFPYQGIPNPIGVPDCESPYLIPDAGGPIRGYVEGDAARPVVTLTSARLEIGMGPPTWFGSFANRSDRLRFTPQIGTGAWIFLGQHGDWRDHAGLGYALAREGTTIESGAVGGPLERTLIPGRHTLTLTNERYWIGDQRCRATVVASFDSRLADPDPPSMRELVGLANGVRSNVVESGAANAFEVAIEDASALAAVMVDARPAGATIWSPLPVTRTGDRFTAALSAAPVGPLALRIDVTDAAGNRLTYTLEPAAIVTASSDVTAPQVSLIAPDGNESWTTGSRQQIRWTATDDQRVDTIEIQFSSDGGGTYATIASGRLDSGAYDWLVPETTGTRMRIKVVARDPSGNTGADASSANFAIVVPTPPDSNRVGNGGFEGGITGWERYGSATLARVSGGRSGTYALQIRASSSSSFGCDDVPNWIGAVAAKGAVYRISAWVKTTTRSRGSVRLRLYEYLGSSQQGSTAYSSTVVLSDTWAPLTMDYVVRTAGTTLSLRIVDSPSASSETFLVDDVSIVLVSGAPPDAAPVVTAPASLSAVAGRATTFTVSAADADGPAIATLTQLGMPSGATFDVNTSRTQGTFAWTPGIADVRADPYVVTFTATSSKSASATTRIVVTEAPPNLCSNGDFESGTSGWGAYGNAALAAVAGGRSGNALRISGSSSFGVDDSPDWLPAPLTKGAVYRIACWVKRASTSGSAGSVKIRVYEYLGTSQQGSTAYSQTLTLTTSWQRLTLDYTVRVQGTRLSLRITDAASSSEIFLVDDVVIEALRTGSTSDPAGASDPSALETTAQRFSAKFIPNPARTEGVLHFVTTRPGPARIDLLDVNGRHVMRLIDERALAPGVHEIRVDRLGRKRLPEGVYFYWIRAGEGAIRGRIVFLQ